MARILSHPVSRTITGASRTLQVGEVSVQAEVRNVRGDLVVVRAVFPLPNGGTAVVERTSGGEWMAAGAGTGGWLPETFETIHDAVEAALSGGGTPQTDETMANARRVAEGE